MDLGDAIRQSREKRGIKQTELAKIIGIAQSQLSSFETGNQRPSQAQMIDISQALNDDRLLIYYKYTSDIYRYLSGKYFNTLGFTSEQHAMIVDKCHDLLTEIKSQAELVLELAEAKDEIFAIELSYLKHRAFTLRAYILMLCEAIDDIQFVV